MKKKIHDNVIDVVSMASMNLSSFSILSETSTWILVFQAIVANTDIQKQTTQ